MQSDPGPLVRRLEGALALAIISVFPSEKKADAAIRRSVALAMVARLSTEARHQLPTITMSLQDAKNIATFTEQKLAKLNLVEGDLNPFNLLQFAATFFSIQPVKGQGHQIVVLKIDELFAAARNSAFLYKGSKLERLMTMFLTPGHFSLPPEAERMAKRALDLFHKNPDLTTIISDGQAALQEIRRRQGHHFDDSEHGATLNGPGWTILGALQGEPGLPSTEEETRQVMAMCLALCTVLPCTSPTQLVRLSIALGIVNSPEQIVRMNGGRHKGVESFAVKTGTWTMKRLEESAATNLPKDVPGLVGDDPLLVLSKSLVTLRIRQVAAITVSLYDKMISGQAPATKQGLVFPPTFFNLDVSLLHFQAQAIMTCMLKLMLSDTDRPHMLHQLVQDLRHLSAGVPPDEASKLQAALEASAARGSNTWLPPGRAIPLRQQTKQLQAVAKVAAQELRNLAASGEACVQNGGTSGGGAAGPSASSSSTATRQQAVVGMEYHEEEAGWKVAKMQKITGQQKQSLINPQSSSAGQAGQVASFPGGTSDSSPVQWEPQTPEQESQSVVSASAQKEEGVRKGETWVTGMDQFLAALAKQGIQYIPSDSEEEEEEQHMRAAPQPVAAQASHVAQAVQQAAPPAAAVQQQGSANPLPGTIQQQQVPLTAVATPSVPAAAAAPAPAAVQQVQQQYQAPVPSPVPTGLSTPLPTLLHNAMLAYQQQQQQQQQGIPHVWVSGSAATPLPASAAAVAMPFSAPNQPMYTFGGFVPSVAGVPSVTAFPAQQAVPTTYMVSSAGGGHVLPQPVPVMQMPVPAPAPAAAYAPAPIPTPQAGMAKAPQGVKKAGEEDELLSLLLGE